MSLVFGDTGAESMLKARFNNQWPTVKDLTIKLFTNNIVPTDDHTAVDYTEAAGGGYALKTLTCGSWTINPANNPRDAVYAEQIWTFTGALSGSATVYGYFVVDDDGVFQWAEQISPVMAPANNGDQLKITPQFQLSKGTPTA
jgi:hypothetical protein